jgi:hypothetical protein
VTNLLVPLLSWPSFTELALCITLITTIRTCLYYLSIKYHSIMIIYYHSIWYDCMIIFYSIIIKKARWFFRSIWKRTTTIISGLESFWCFDRRYWKIVRRWWDVGWIVPAYDSIYFIDLGTNVLSTYIELGCMSSSERLSVWWGRTLSYSWSSCCF